MTPPSHFTPAGEVTYARLMLTDPPFLRKKKYTGRRAAGVRYEKKVHEHLLFLYPDTYVPGPWIYFRANGSSQHRWCQPDGLIFDVPRGIITCVEVKYSHTSDAWWQVKKLYLPVLRKIFPEDLWRLQVCEVVKWYDPATFFPEPTRMTVDITHPTDKFKVHIWRP
jgi:hypothetical protein